MNAKNWKLKASAAAPAIDWAAVDADPKANVPDHDSPELTRVQAAQLRPLTDVLPDFSIGKTRITINLDDAVLQAYKARAGGRGQRRGNSVPTAAFASAGVGAGVRGGGAE